MTGFTTISTGALLVDKPITSDIGIALRDNPISISEGASGAPVVRAGWHPYNQTIVGTNDGTLYSSAVSGTVSNVVSADFDDGYEYAFDFDQVSHNGVGSRDFQVEVYRATSAAYSTAVSLATLALASNSASGRLEILHPRLTRKAHVGMANVFVDTSDGIATGISAGIAIKHTTAQKLLRVRFSFSADSIDSGIIYMYRRRAD